VRAALDADLPVDVIPGPSAMLTALTGSGMGGGEFFFGGFLPAKRAQRIKTLESVRLLEATLVFYEAPHRILETLEDIAAQLPGRPVCAARELTKLHEEWLRGTPSEVAAVLRKRDAIKGEFTLVLGKAEAVAANESAEPIEHAVQRAIDAGADRMAAIKEAAKARGLSKREVYRMLEAARER
jgi:16S rRNA (cytidine1402-2'-O)-methyltransferase